MTTNRVVVMVGINNETIAVTATREGISRLCTGTTRTTHVWVCVCVLVHTLGVRLRGRGWGWGLRLSECGGVDPDINIIYNGNV